MSFLHATLFTKKEDLKLNLCTKICLKSLSIFITERVTSSAFDLIEMTDFPKDTDSYYSEVTEVTDEPAVLSLAGELKRALERRSIRLGVKKCEECTCAGACNCIGN